MKTKSVKTSSTKGAPGKAEITTRTIDFPRPMMKELKVLAAERETNVQALVLEAITSFLKASKI